MQLRVVAVGESASTLRGRFVHLLDPAVPARVTWLAPAEVSGDAVVLTDDLRAAELRDLLLRITSPAGVCGRGLVLSWDAPRHSAALFGVPFHRLLSLPEQRGEVLPWLRQLAGPSAWPLKVGSLAEGVSGALALAVRVVLNRAADTAAPPPDQSRNSAGRWGATAPTSTWPRRPAASTFSVACVSLGCGGWHCERERSNRKRWPLRSAIVTDATSGGTSGGRTTSTSPKFQSWTWPRSTPQSGG